MDDNLYCKSNLSNLDSYKPLAYRVDELKQIVEAPRLLWDKDFSCFEVTGHSYSDLSNAVYQCPTESECNQAALNLASQTAKEFLTVVERQAEKYLPGGTFCNLEPEMVVLGTNAPADNMVAESILGLTDNLIRKVRNASGAYITAKTYFW